MNAHESAMLNWLGKEWGIAVRIEESGSGDDACSGIDTCVDEPEESLDLARVVRRLVGGA